MNSSIRFALLPFLLLAPACSNHNDRSGSPIFNASSSAIQAAMGDSPSAEFYKRNRWQPVWSDSSAKVLQQELSQRTRHGLDRVGFLSDISKASPADKEAALTKAALGYAAALANGTADPTKLYDIYTIPRPQPDLIAGLQQALADGKLAEWLDDLAPSDGEYAALSKAYLDYREQAGYAAQHPVPAGDTIHPGASDPRIPALRDLLTRAGYLQAQAAQPQQGQGGQVVDRYTPDMVAAVKAVQDENGLQKNGAVDQGTLAALNRVLVARARALAVAMERRRWLKRTPPTTRIDVNTAAATLSYVRDGKLADYRKVVVGQPGKETPQIEAPIYRLVANPTWTVPKSIAATELADKGGGYLNSHNMVRKDGWIVQQSGPQNSLGLVKFDMDDKYEIYLHDTPAKSLFGLDERQRSHGCVRVQDALGFADQIAGQQGVTRQWRQARQKKDETFVPLPQKIPVRLLYHPTFVDRSGKVHFGDDIYDWNGAVAKLLGYDTAPGRRVTATVDDLGP